jgi:peptide/nickel transport system substrate-binding protein
MEVVMVDRRVTGRTAEHGRRRLAFACFLLLAVAVGACTSSGSKSSSAGTGSTGRTAPSSGTGTKIAGGTVYFTEGPSSPPNYVFPMTNAQVCGTNNINQLLNLMYRPLYWYGDNYTPTVDFNRSIGQQPTFTDNNQTVTVKLNKYMWSNGEQVTSRDVAMYINLYKADPGSNYCGYVPGYFPDNVTSVDTPDNTTVVLHLDKSYNPEWFLYNELSQIYPLPLAWDRTSLSQPAPTSTTASLPDTTKAGAEAVYKFLDAQARATATWASSPIWSVVDGPFKLQSFTTAGQVTLVPNTSYSGSPKPSISKLVELPFTDDTAEFNEIRSGGPAAVTIANLPSQYAPQASAVQSQGYTYDKSATYSVNYFPLNLNNPKLGPVFRQLYFRQAFQELVDQRGWIHAFLHDTANPTYSPIPPSPPSPLVSFNASSNPYPYSTSAAAKLLTSNGWNVVPGGQTTCKNAGSGPGQCGAGIPAGQTISFNLDYQAGAATIASEMNDLAANAKKVGINLQLTTHPFDTVIQTATQCKPTQSTCGWTAENWGAGWIYGPDYLPTGESLFVPGAVADYSNYSNAKATSLIEATVTGPAAQEKSALTAYANYMEQQLPVVYGPTSIGTYQGDAGTMVDKHLGGYVANALGLMDPEDWYFTK